MRLALGTNGYTDLCRDHGSVVETVELADEVWLPFIVLGELCAGFAVGSQGVRNEAVLRRFLLKPSVGVLFADEQTTHFFRREGYSKNIACETRSSAADSAPVRHPLCFSHLDFFWPDHLVCDEASFTEPLGYRPRGWDSVRMGHDWLVRRFFLYAGTNFPANPQPQSG